jgi:hypothetical protein
MRPRTGVLQRRRGQRRSIRGEEGRLLRGERVFLTTLTTHTGDMQQYNGRVISAFLQTAPEQGGYCTRAALHGAGLPTITRRTSAC